MTEMRLKPGEFLGDAMSTRIADAIFSHVIHHEARSLPLHDHEWPYVSMLLQGFYSETVGRETISFQPFTAVFHGAKLVHDDEIGSGGARFFLIEFGESWLELIERLGGTPRHVHELYGEGASWPALRAYYHFAGGTLDTENVEESLFELCAHLPRASPPETEEPQWLNDVQEEVLNNFCGPYSLRKLAETVHVDPSHLARTFYRFRRCTIGEFVNRLRVQQACRQLAELDQSLETIARMNGFADQSHMTRAIRQLSGSTPAVLRRLLKSSEP